VKANFKSLGAKYGKDVQEISKAIAALDATTLVKTLRASASTKVATWEIELGDLVVTEVPKNGWMVASHEGESVALDLALSQTLIDAGHVREVIRYIQERRKGDGFEISDRIKVRWNADPAIVAAISQSASHISDEVLALKFTHDASLPAGDNELQISAELIKA
jgi:isoleucyl-tRNA synthetase